jgi:non-specific serine/threonine protein kinase
MNKLTLTKIKHLDGIITQDNFEIERFNSDRFEFQYSEIKDWSQKFSSNKYEALLHLSFLENQKWFSPMLKYIHSISEVFLEHLIRSSGIEALRDQVEVPLTDDLIHSFIDQKPFIIGNEFITSDWVCNQWNKLLLTYQKEISEYSGSVSNYFDTKNPNLHIADRIFFHLMEYDHEDYPFAFMATYAKKGKGHALHVPLKSALEEFKNDHGQVISLISSVLNVSNKSVLIAGLIESGELFHPIGLTTTETYQFLNEINIYEEHGIMCRVPNWWKRRNKNFSLSLKIGDEIPSHVGIDAILDFKPVIDFKQDEISVEELKQFSEMAEGLIRYKGQWIEVNHNQINNIIENFETVIKKTQNNDFTLLDIMKQNIDDATGIPSIEVTNGEWVNSMLLKMTNPERFIEETPSDRFNATLRHYQLGGLNWLMTMNQLKLGACLADDMGLGKTIQILALIDKKLETLSKTLLVVPASLIGNWEHEINKFAPHLKYKILHKMRNKDLDINEDFNVYITTYNMVSRIDAIGETNWDLLILDEAQAIKNSSTKQSKNIKLINSKMRLALTGTPIENSLGDLWSLFDFLNPGLLGTQTEFKKLVRKMQNSEHGYKKLRQMIQPFLLRRVKTDKNIISDLPDKIEIIDYPTLSKKQITLYKSLVDDIMRKLETTTHAERLGLILSSLTKFKQICNHPDQYLGLKDYSKRSSGKFELLEDLVLTIKSKHEKVIVFTQFKEMTQPISDLLESIYDKEGYVLHGGTPVKKRQEMVESFNSDFNIPFMVLSLKAGGTGLNLTSANHVIHFDRWWNPAVENQATDRAFRIGQTKDVMVHKFVTQGTIEEKIDKMIEEKQSLAQELLEVKGEKWITELSNKELHDLFKFGG